MYDEMYVYIWKMYCLLYDSLFFDRILRGALDSIKFNNVISIGINIYDDKQIYHLFQVFRMVKDESLERSHQQEEL